VSPRSSQFAFARFVAFAALPTVCIHIRRRSDTAHAVPLSKRIAFARAVSY